jgi:hypothetical protein
VHFSPSFLILINALRLKRDIRAPAAHILHQKCLILKDITITAMPTTTPGQGNITAQDSRPTNCCKKMAIGRGGATDSKGSWALVQKLFIPKTETPTAKDRKDIRKRHTYPI